MVNKYEYLERMPVDSRIVEQISRSPAMTSEQGANFMQKYGGPGGYIQFSKMPREQRFVMAACLDGYSDPEQIAIATGMDLKDVNAALNKLQKEGFVDISQEPSPK